MYRALRLALLTLPVLAGAIDISKRRDCGFRLTDRQDIAFLDHDKFMAWNDRDGIVHLLNIAKAEAKSGANDVIRALKVNFRDRIKNWYLAGDKLMMDHASHFGSSVLDIHDFASEQSVRLFLPNIITILPSPHEGEVLLVLDTVHEFGELEIKRYIPETNTFLKDIAVPIDGIVTEVQRHGDGKSLLVGVVKGKVRSGVVIDLP